jgi:hypothetical protein
MLDKRKRLKAGRRFVAGIHSKKTQILRGGNAKIPVIYKEILMPGYLCGTTIHPDKNQTSVVS